MIPHSKGIPFKEACSISLQQTAQKCGRKSHESHAASRESAAPWANTWPLVTGRKQAVHRTVNLRSFPFHLRLTYCNVHYFQWNDTTCVSAGWGKFHFVFFIIRQICRKLKQNFYKDLICDTVKSKYYFIKWVILHNMNINIITIVKNFL